VVAALGWPSIKPAYSFQRRLLNDFMSKTHSDGFLYSGASRWRMIIGYARVSTTELNLGLRHDDVTPAFDAWVDPTEARKLAGWRP
jgi:hypothetical protein